MELNDLNLYPWIRPYVLRLIQGPTGFCVGGVKAEDPISSTPATPIENLPNVTDMFSVAIPFAGEILRMQIIFDGTNQAAAPDIMLPDYEDFDPEYDEIKSLVKWDRTDESCLLKAIQDIMGMYKEHHRKKCSVLDDRFSSELAELYASEYKNIEVCLKRADKNGVRRIVNILIQIDVDTSSLDDSDSPPPDIFIHSPLLLIKNDFEANKVVPLLYLPARIEYLFGGRGSLTPPVHTPGISFLTYTNKMKEKLQDTIKLLSESHDKRREYVAAFLSLFTGHSVEYDAKSFHKISLIFCHQTFFFLIHVTLSRFFPRDQPSITFQSAYHLNKKNQLFQLSSCDYPYSPRWPGPEMAKRTKSFILDKIGAFKESCIRQGTL
uniref:BRISC and BRCA1-A complex member 2 n=1 Tax=Phallusia mammillata TaxID=59560 RepID=A0A6F9D7Y5_9ASCI|nr:BRCA1-A complex subunit BRE-like [Phallusia mammillata]